mmetsp:Transcript_23220/g.39444  ORF Transcript_23220/g.39444 Transcript_23220/m.39444 type:complete len:141 (-) Transcript_23220:7-429(-)
MRLIVVFLSILASASAFAVNRIPSRVATRLQGQIPEEMMGPEQLEIKKIQEKWKEAKFMSQEEAEAKLDPEYLAAYNRYYEDWDKGIEKMTEIATYLDKQLNPPKVQKKSKKQKKRDKWAKVQAREAARAARLAGPKSTE